jgi:hypothetical protein
MNREDKTIALRLLLILISAVTSGLLVMAFGCFFALSSAMSDRDLTIAGLYFGTSLEILTLILIVTLFTMHLKVPSKERLKYMRQIMIKNKKEGRTISEDSLAAFPRIAKRFFLTKFDAEE